MRQTLVVQSHRLPLPYRWLQGCIDSVGAWARGRGYDYRFLGDEIFEFVDPDLREKTALSTVIATDLARLGLIRSELAGDYHRVVWCDADFLVFDPAAFELPDAAFAFGREVWVQRDDRGRLRAYPKLHNALLMFRRDNRFLEFYIDTAERLLRLNQCGMPPQFIGPKLLTALHNIAHFTVMESAGMLSPPVIRDLLSGAGPALDLFRDKSPAVLAGANLGGSLVEAEAFTEAQMQTLIERLLDRAV